MLDIKPGYSRSEQNSNLVSRTQQTVMCTRSIGFFDVSDEHLSDTNILKLIQKYRAHTA